MLENLMAVFIILCDVALLHQLPRHMKKSSGGFVKKVYSKTREWEPENEEPVSQKFTIYTPYKQEPV